ncbi:hypothetical protein NUW58_g6889 [Xylaria curta]|uniref:Uncharacterized protein n=1 Tax=Xylaria curta TaxID=42375 RepID=A0ACC1NPB6_9PEZI|nr:hypothetical protein NUW58_g6889 [Xylaria curta]
MRASLPAIALCALGVSAAMLPVSREVETREDSVGSWYMVGFKPLCGYFGCGNTDYCVFGAANAVPGAPAMALRCNSYAIGGCENTLPGSSVHAFVSPGNAGKLTLTQNFTSPEGKNFIATGVYDWNGLSLTSFTIPVTVQAA